MSRARDDGAEIDLDAAGITLARWVVGDRTGLAIFLGAAVFFALSWRIGIFSSDTYAVANSLVGVVDGHLHVDSVRYGPPSGITPGMNVVDGRLYGRNYGLVVAALPLVWLQWGLAAVVDLRIALAGAWSLGVLAFVALVGERFGRPRVGVTVGALLALVLFGANAAVATPIPPRWYPVVALQAVTMTAAGLTAVFLYRLLRRMYGSRVGWVAGAAVALASPVAFWSAFPKRHAVTAFLVVLTLYCLYRSRESEAGGAALRFRALAYVPVGLTAWVHSAEGLVLLVALAAADVPTARSNRPRDLAAVGAALLLSLVPFFLTNYLIAGNPLRPPRLLSAYTDVSQRAEIATGSGGDAGSAGTASDGTTVTGGGASGSTGPSDAGGTTERTGGTSRDTNGPAWWWRPIAVVGGYAAIVVDSVELLLAVIRKGFGPLADGDKMTDVFVRSGYVDGLPTHNDRSINLSVLESMPLFGAVALVPALVARRVRGSQLDVSVSTVLGWVRRTRRDPVRVVDAFVVVYLALLVPLYMSRLPLQFMLTGRYLHPIYPLGVYVLARQPPVRRAVTEHGRRVGAAYGLTVLAGIPLYLGALAALEAVMSEAVQLFALVSLSVASLVVVWAGLESVGGERARRASALLVPALGVAAGLTTVYLLVSGLGFFAYTHEFALPLSRLVAERLLPINPLRSFF